MVLRVLLFELLVQKLEYAGIVHCACFFSILESDQGCLCVALSV